MIKYFCDACGDELERNVVAERIKESTVIRGTLVEVEIMVGISSVLDEGHLCKSCLFLALDRFDSRPRAVDAA